MREAPQNSHVVNSQRLALLVERYHTWPRVTHQNDGEHSAQVMRIYVRLFGCPPSHVWLFILQHDMPEMRIGDWPFSGNFAPELKAAKLAVEARVRPAMGLGQHAPLIVEEEQRVKLCDMMDCWEWGAHEERLGNVFGRTVMNNVEEPIVKMAKALGCDRLVRAHMEEVARRP